MKFAIGCALASQLLLVACGDRAESRDESAASRNLLLASAARLTMQLAYEVYPRWRRATNKSCPTDVADLLGGSPRQSVEDPWGNPPILVCGARAPREANGFGVISAAADGRFGTADDIASWMDDYGRDTSAPLSRPEVTVRVAIERLKRKRELARLKRRAANDSQATSGPRPATE